MATTIVIAGKGGVGKTTISGLIVGCLRKSGRTPILAVDADPNVNLNQVLGIEVESTVGQVREDTLKSIGDIPAGMPKESFLELKIQEAVSEGNGFDILVMGRPEGPGCYCYANSILRKHVDVLSKSYKYLVIDSEAGMEHLSRRTTQNVDHLLLVSDAAIRGIQTAARIRELALELGLRIGKMWFIINRVPATGANEILGREIDKQHLNLLGAVPEDPLIAEFDLNQRSVLELPGESPASKAVCEMVRKLVEEES